jgi:N-acetylglucosaminyldiphosphoundecaprenol N-acetyl-beta-D-mannosaminyltransferase
VLIVVEPVDQTRRGSKRTTYSVLGAPIDTVDWHTALGRIERWGASRESRYVCICNVHSVTTARQDSEFSRVLAESDMNTPDGAPIAWFLRRNGFRRQQRINGPDLMLQHSALAARSGQPIYLFGGADTTLQLLREKLLGDFPNLVIAGMYSPPFRKLTKHEDEEIVERINASGAQVVWVGLGCPKQELWMAAHRGRINAVMVGVGAAFDYHAGTIRRAPPWMRDAGLEWAYRLACEPRRLARRYAVTNSLFLGLVGREMLFKRRGKHSQAKP